jgi:N-acyl-D-amino-acid deacylase
VQSLLPAWTVQLGPDAIIRKLNEPESRKRIEDHLIDMYADWSRFALVGASSATFGPFEGMRFDDIARRLNTSEPNLVMQILETEELRACYVHHAAHEGNVRDILQWPHQMIGSDGLHLPGKTHPRLFGTFPRILGYYVRDEKIIDLPSAVYKMTGQPSARIGLKKRGTLAVGNAADIVLFDAKTVIDTATFEDPAQHPKGIPYVFINGVAAKDADRKTNALAGRVLRRI